MAMLGRWVDRLLRWVDRTAVIAGALAAVLISGMVGITTYDVVARGLFRAPTDWALDIGLFLFLYAALFTMIYASHRDAHVRVDLLTRHFPQKVRRGILILFLPLVLGFIGITIWQGWAVTVLAWKSAATHRGMFTLAVPIWWTQIAVPLAMLWLGTSVIARLYHGLRGAGRDRT
jgi:TRAP-type C4-dicarboxylate transport system permease small subunit